MRLSRVILLATVITVSLVAIGAFGTTPPKTQAAASQYSGTVTINGLPAPNGTLVYVYVSGISTPCTQTTTSNGFYSVTVSDSLGNAFCPTPGTTPTLNFVVGLNTAGTTTFSSVSTSVQLHLCAPNCAGTGTGTGTGHTISGTLFNSSSQPLSGQTLQAYVGNILCPTATTTTLANGQYTLNIPPNTCGTIGSLITILANGQATSMNPQITFQSPFTSNPINLTVGGTGTGTGSAGIHVVSGTVFNNGVVYPSAIVQVLVANVPCGGASQITDAFGRFTINVPITCGAVPGGTISFNVNSQSATSSQYPTLTSGLVSAGITLTANATSTIGTHLILGRLVNASQTPLPNYTIQAYAAGNFCSGASAQTDANGNFSLTVQTACNTIGAALTFQAGGQSVSQSVTPSLSSGGITSNVTLTLGSTGTQAGTHTISGRVVQGGTSNPVSNTVVQALVNGIICQGAQTTSATDGTFTVNVPGSCVGTNRAITFMVSGTVVPQSQAIDWVPGATNSNVTLTYGSGTATTPIATTVPAATVTPTATATTSPPASTAQWLDQPPGSTGAQKACPEAGKWVQLYWDGAAGEPILTAASVCEKTDPYWVNRRGTWLGFTIVSPSASDSWNLFVGEAHFMRGQPQQ